MYVTLTKKDEDVICQMNLFLKYKCASVKLGFFLTKADDGLCIWNTFLPGSGALLKLKPPGKVILVAGILHLVLGQVSFNLCIAWVAFFFGLLCLFCDMESRGLRGTTKHVPDSVLPPYLDECEWLLPSPRFGFHGQKIYM